MSHNPFIDGPLAVRLFFDIMRSFVKLFIMSKLLTSVLSVLALLVPQKAFAVCPVCTFAAGGGLVFSRWLGVDDLIASLWIGALIMSVSLWTINWLNKRKIRFLGRKPLVFAFFYASVLYPFYSYDFIGVAGNTFWGYDKIIFGIIAGSLIFAFSILAHLELKKLNDDKPYFSAQKIVMGFLPMLIASLIFYFVL